jgi:putative DNA primase/helicase
MQKYEHIPQELRKLRNWCCWQAVPDSGRPGKIKKIPINAKTGGQAQSNNPETWCDFDTAVTASERFSGIGFMFTGSGFFGVDIDGVEGAIEDYRHGETDNIVGEFIYGLQSYAEFSQSGHGIHIICRGHLPPAGRRRKNVEMYDSGRFFIMTGKYASEFADIADCTESIKPLHEKYIGGGTEPTTGIAPPAPLNLSESEIIHLAEDSKQGDAFRTLYAGKWETIYTSQSEADLGFCNMLAFWCRKDERMMDRIFRSSGLMREKWDRKQSGTTYGKITLQKAIKGCQRTYEPKSEYHIVIGQPAAKPEKKKLYSFDDTGNAERLVDTFGKQIRYSYVNKSWLYYDGRKWCFDVTGAIHRMADEIVETMRDDENYFVQNAPESWGDTEAVEKNFMKHLKQSRSNRGKENMIKESQHHVPITPDQLDTHKTLLCMPNGIINLKTGELQPHDRQKFITKITHCEYTDKIDHPLWDSFLESTFGGDRDLIHYIQKAVGYSLTGSTQEQCAFFCYGTGRNGKSTFLETISDALGDYATNIQPETIMVKPGTSGPTSDIARLKGARFVTCSEPNEGVRLNEGLIKQLTGGDKVTASRKFENEFEFYPEFKLWMSTNHKPVIRGTDVGIWRRICLIPFTVCIPEEKIDKNLKFKLQRELSGILKWAVDGCLMWQREGLKQPAAVAAATAEYRSEMDVISAFIAECCETGTGEEWDHDLYEAYVKWAKENNEYEMSSRKFNTEMLKKFERRKTNSKRYFQNVSLILSCKIYHGVQFKNV